MSTIDDFIRVYSAAKENFYLYGPVSNQAEWSKAIDSGLEKVWEAIREDSGGITQDQANELPRETELGPKGERAFQEYLAHLKKVR